MNPQIQLLAVDLAPNVDSANPIPTVSRVSRERTLTSYSVQSSALGGSRAKAEL
jgi:hypothetical protein